MEEFNNYVEPCSFLVTFGNPPAPEELKNIDGISEVEPLTLREYRVYFTAPAGITQQVIARSVEKGWQLEEICLERESLDTILHVYLRIVNDMRLKDFNIVYQIARTELRVIFILL